jgi:CheY-like chemotaxis protein
MKICRHVLILEDDPTQRKSIERKVAAKWRGVSISHAETESDFREVVNRIATEDLPLPDLVLSDMMVPWAFPSPTPRPVPEDMKTETYHQAGMRCWKFYRDKIDHDLVAKTPWVYFSILPEQVLPGARCDSWTWYVRKDQGVDGLSAKIDEIDADWTESPEAETQDLLSVQQMKSKLLKGIGTPWNQCQPWKTA